MYNGENNLLKSHLPYFDGIGAGDLQRCMRKSSYGRLIGPTTEIKRLNIHIPNLKEIHYVFLILPEVIKIE